MKTLPSQEYLKSRIDYNPETGEARWKEVDESYGPNWKTFNSRDAGKLITDRARINGKQYLLPRLIKILTYGSSASIDIDSKQTRKNSLVANTLSLVGIEQYISYEHKTGNLIFMPRVGNPAFNAQYAGKSASRLHKSSGYFRTKVLGKDYASHRVAWYLYYGIDPGGYLIDHIDSNKTNNIITNLRLANYSLNTQNRKNTKGYSFESGKYRVKIGINNIMYTVGSYDTEEEARDAYESALVKYKPIYEYTSEEQSILDELYLNFPNVTKDLQHRAHEIQVKALEHYINAGE